VSAAILSGRRCSFDVSNQMTIAREEIFGPVLSVIAYDDEEQAVAAGE